jgi:Fe2+ transport system protein FeoA
MSGIPLNRLRLGQAGTIIEIDTGDNALRAELGEFGFVEGEPVELLERGAFGTPIAVRLRRTIIALRRREAEAIKVQAA